MWLDQAEWVGHANDFRLLLYFENKSVEFETRHLWTLQYRVYMTWLLDLCIINQALTTCMCLVLNWHLHILKRNKTSDNFIRRNKLYRKNVCSVKVEANKIIQCLDLLFTFSYTCNYSNIFPFTFLLTTMK